ncbi:phenylalanine--tRNA ligase subunit beta [Aquirhabdus sp.]|uniref:phenylalanine--tRNA ligase subunit beta n=1 Tax=Aquirhabdus sp. TaxID=2824160 RepID=UPI00396C571D
MKISESWLRSWVNPAVDSEALAHQLTMAGLEIDSNESVAPFFHGVVVGEVLTVVQHPDADRLRITTVNAGASVNNGEPLQIVCGAPNVAVGLKVAVALIGAVLPKDFKIKPSKLRGVDSQGMLCGATEIGLDDGVDGLMLLPSDAPIGVDIREYLKLDDRILELGITPNRGDCLSVKGIARELGVINSLTVNEPVIAIAPVTSDRKLSIQIADDVQRHGCPRYAGRVITGINPQAKTPTWMADALVRSGVRTHSVLVDITNYVLLELGQPLHAFDANTLQGGISVRVSEAGEKLTLLNDQEVTLDNDTLLICDESGAVAMAGVMGGLRSSVTDATTDIFLESAFFEPLALAGRARRYGLHTDASHRYERGVDFELPLPAIERATTLILQLAGGHAGPVTVVEQVAALPKRAPIYFTLGQVQRLLGFEVTADFVLHTLLSLGLQVTGNENGWNATPPSHRFDMSIAPDLSEEVARIYGYDNIPVKFPVQPMTLIPTEDRLSTQALRQTLVTLGYQEAVSFSFVDEKLERILNPDVNPLHLANPMSSELGVMRTTLLSSLIPCVQYNLNRQQNRVRFFETGLRFVPNAAQEISELQQIPTLALIATGGRVPEQWTEAKPKMDFYDFKADVSQVLLSGRIGVSFIKSTRPWLHPGQSAEIIQHGITIGYLGRLHPSLEDSLDLGVTWVAELDIAPLTAPQVSKFTELSRFPSVRRDIAVLISDSIQVSQIQTTIAAVAGDSMTKVWLFDEYTGQGVDVGLRSLAFALLWQHPERTLEDTEIKDGMQRVVEALSHTYGATLRAS